MPTYINLTGSDVSSVASLTEVKGVYHNNGSGWDLITEIYINNSGGATSDASAMDKVFGTLEDETIAHLERCSTLPSLGLIYDLNTLIKTLKDDGLWSKFDQLCVVHENAADSLLSLTGSNDATYRNGTPTFTANQGFLCAVGGLGQIDGQLTESAAPSYAQYDGHIMAYIRNKVDNNGNTWGFLTNGSRCLDSALPAWQLYVQGVNSAAFSTSIGGTLIGTITASNQRDFVFNDSNNSNTTPTSYTLQTTGVFACNGGTFGSFDQEFSCWSFGSGMTLAEAQDYENAIRAFAQARGFDVY